MEKIKLKPKRLLPILMLTVVVLYIVNVPYYSVISVANGIRIKPELFLHEPTFAFDYYKIIELIITLLLYAYICFFYTRKKVENGLFICFAIKSVFSLIILISMLVSSMEYFSFEQIQQAVTFCQIYIARFFCDIAMLAVIFGGATKRFVLCIPAVLGTIINSVILVKFLVENLELLNWPLSSFLRGMFWDTFLRNIIMILWNVVMVLFFAYNEIVPKKRSNSQNTASAESFSSIDILKELDRLKANNEITEEEYEARRSEVISRL